MNELYSRNDRSQRCAIAIMAKAPSSGRIKTRLSAILAPEEAAALGRCFLRDMTANLARAGESAAIDPYVAFAPAGTEAAFDGVVESGTRFILADGIIPAPAGIIGLGVSLLHAMRALFEIGYGAVGLLNSDSPTLPITRLIEAARWLESPGERVVLGPALDGGYYLIGAKAPHAGLFQSVDWSTKHVAEQTRARVAELGLTLLDLEPWYDVDDVMSLRRLVRDLQLDSTTQGPPYPAPATRRFLSTNRIADRLPMQFADAQERCPTLR